MKTVRLFVIVGLGVLLVSSLVPAKELYVGIATEPWDLDPAIRTDTGSGYIITNVYDPLIALDQSNEPTAEFTLCTSWELKNNAQTIVLFLREGVKFHDGTDFTAADVKYNIDWMLDPDNNAPNKGLLGPIESVNIIDDFTLEVNFSDPYTGVLQQWSRVLDGIVPQWAHGERSEEKGVAGFAGTDLSRNPIGTGPFKFVDWVSGSHITLERFDDYWAAGVPAEGIDTVVFEIVGDPAAMQAALIAGSLHIVDKVAFRDFEALSRMPGIMTKRIPGIQTQYVTLNLGAPPFGITADQVGDEAAIEKAYNLRKFMFYAIDREEIAEELFYGMGTNQYGPWYPDSEWTSPNLKGMTLHDPVLAQEYLTKAGYPDGGLSFRMIATNVQWFVDVSTIIQEQLRPYGVAVEVIPIDKSAFFDVLYETFDWESGMEDWGYSNFLAISWLFSGYYRNNHNHNHWHHTAPDLLEYYHETVPGHAEYCALYDEAIVEPDEQKRKELVWQMQEMLVENVIRIDLMILDNLHAWRDTVKGFGDGLNSRGDIDLKYITEFMGSDGAQPTGDLTVYDGVGGNAVPNNREVTRGAFTVANLNDTDGDGTIDKADDKVPGEKDLLKLVIEKPVNMPAASIRLTITGDGTKTLLWKKSDKSAGREKRRVFPVAGTAWPVTMWVEGLQKSGAVRDITITITHIGTGKILDTAKATFVWATKTGFKNRPADALWADAGNPLKNTFETTYGGQFGKQFAGPPVKVQYAMGMEFTVEPAGVGALSGVVFDVTRQIACKDWHTNAAGTAFVKWPLWEAFPIGATIDLPNDEALTQTDNDNTPLNNHIYSIDGPGFPNSGAYAQVVGRNNFYEYVRVRFDGATLAGENLDGSRCSLKAPWQAFFWIEKTPAGNSYQERTGKPNEVKEGHGSLDDPAPVP